MEVTINAPVIRVGITDDPVFFFSFFLLSPAYNEDGMVHKLSWLRGLFINFYVLMHFICFGFEGLVWYRSLLHDAALVVPPLSTYVHRSNNGTVPKELSLNLLRFNLKVIISAYVISLFHASKLRALSIVFALVWRAKVFVGSAFFRSKMTMLGEEAVVVRQASFTATCHVVARK